MPDQVPDEVKHERLERLVEVCSGSPPSGTPSASAASRRCSSRARAATDERCCGAARAEHDRQLRRRRRARRARRRPDRGRHLDDAARRAADGGGRVRVLLTGCSGQIGTNLALRLQPDGHEVFGVDKRQNTWTDDFPTCSRISPATTPPFPGGINGVEYPEVDLVVHLAAHAKVHQLVAQPHRALENADDDLQRPRVLPPAAACRSSSPRRARSTATSTASRATARRRPTSPSRRARTPPRRSRARRSSTRYARCYGLPTWSSASRTSTAATTTTWSGWSRVLPLFIHRCCAASRSPSTAATTRCSTSPTSTTASTGSRAGSRRSRTGACERDDQPRLRRGQHARPRCRADRSRARRRAADEIAPSLLGEVTHYVADIRKARDLLDWEPKTPLDEGIPRAVAWFAEHRAAHPEEDGPVDADHGRAAEDARRRLEDLSARASVLAIFGPTASGKSAVAEAIAARIPAELVSADSMQVYRGLPVLTEQDAGAGSSASGRSTGRGRSASTSALAHAAIDEILAAGRTPVVVGGSGLCLRAALAEVALPPDVPPGARARWERLYDRRGAGRPTACSQARPRAAARIHRTTAGASCGRSSSGRRARRSPRRTAPVGGRGAAADAVVGLDVPKDARAADPSARRRRCSSVGWRRRCGRRADVVPAGAGPRGRGRCRGRRAQELVARRAATPPTSESGCGGFRASLWSMPTGPRERWRMQFSKWHALGNSYLLLEREELGSPLEAALARALCDVRYGIGADGVLELLEVDGAAASMAIWNPDGSAAEFSGNGTRIAALWLARRSRLADVSIAVGGRGATRRDCGRTARRDAVGAVEVGGSRRSTRRRAGRAHARVGRQPARGCAREPNRDGLLRLGPLIEAHEPLPRPDERPARARRRAARVTAAVWERGAGETSASGSSAVAVAAAAIVNGWCESPVCVRMPGGELRSRARRREPGDPHRPGGGDLRGRLPRPLGVRTGRLRRRARTRRTRVQARAARRGLASLADDERAGELYVPAGNSFGRVPGTTTARGGTRAGCSTGSGAGDVDDGTGREHDVRAEHRPGADAHALDHDRSASR